MASGLTTSAVRFGRQKLPAAVSTAYLQKRNAGSDLAACKRGRGGRSSFSGVVATVFGASGFMGRHIVNRLGKIGSQVIIPYRGDTYRIARMKLAGDLGQILFTPFDSIYHEDQLRKAMMHSNLVINLIGKEFETKAYDYHDLFVDAPTQIAKIAKEMGVERLIHFSHLNADPHRNDLIYFGENIQKGNSMLQKKWEGDQAVREIFPEATIFRPADIYGIRDRYFWKYVHKTRYGYLSYKIPIWREGHDTVKQPVFAGDVATGVTNAIFDSDAPGSTYYCVGPERYTLNNLVNHITRLCHRDYWEITDIDVAFIRKLERQRDNRIFNFDSLQREALSDFIVDKDVAKTLEDLDVKPRSLQDMASIVTNSYVNFKILDQEYLQKQIQVPKLVPVDD
ncbi:NADH dehydrogenase [ubiquinone] 1 alpha subcomplex subunit 9, mitochondrial-like isoform X2 [Saccostrea echinata]|uniref:NADH dehydrogenase [ubiquinone] 1 alpha subcomplex subunit 9, mitochondrial-like isoform X2 n=1 Tax=Saccostrea echinata TaxID=191078 RepID=UPI002A7EEA9A|nr:NADH dehydrogenase [ubiquinone] 1 alpha subcomplex subunit 9, mitochondrial-like isoform X2 [Saccostrea echinata]